MPCYDDRSSGSYVRAEMQAKLDKLTRVACELSKLVEPSALLCVSEETRLWVKEHEEFDRRRAERGV